MISLSNNQINKLICYQKIPAPLKSVEFNEHLAQELGNKIYSALIAAYKKENPELDVLEAFSQIQLIRWLAVH